MSLRSKIIVPLLIAASLNFNACAPSKPVFQNKLPQTEGAQMPAKAHFNTFADSLEKSSVMLDNTSDTLILSEMSKLNDKDSFSRFLMLLNSIDTAFLERNHDTILAQLEEFRDMFMTSKPDSFMISKSDYMNNPKYPQFVPDDRPCPVIFKRPVFTGYSYIDSFSLPDSAALEPQRHTQVVSSIRSYFDESLFTYFIERGLLSADECRSLGQACLEARDSLASCTLPIQLRDTAKADLMRTSLHYFGVQLRLNWGVCQTLALSDPADGVWSVEIQLKAPFPSAQALYDCGVLMGHIKP